MTYDLNAISTVASVASSYQAGGVTDPRAIAGATQSPSHWSSTKGIRALSGGASPIRFVHSDAIKLVNAAVANGSAIEQALQELLRALEVADTASAVSVNANRLDKNGTRISVVNISSQMHRLMDRIDDLAKAAEVKNGNLLSSRGRKVRIQTSAFGGRLDVAPQPLDVKGLGLEGMDLLANGGITDARGRVSKASLLTSQRLMRLEALQRALGDPYTQYSEFQKVAGDFSFDKTALGGVIDLRA